MLGYNQFPALSTMYITTWPMPSIAMYCGKIKEAEICHASQMIRACIVLAPNLHVYKWHLMWASIDFEIYCELSLRFYWYILSGYDS
jgi:hypothetical protein